MDASYVQGLHALLVQSTASDTATLKAATAQLNLEYYKNPACISALASILATSPEQSVRQLAAVELRKRISQNSGDFWTQLPQGGREEIKLRLPELILAEPINIVRHSAARVIAAIAEIEMQAGTWPQLMPFLEQTCTSSQVSHREVGIYMLYTVLEEIAAGVQQYNSLFILLSGLLVDPESITVRITAVKAIGVIANLVDLDAKSDVKALQQLFLGMIHVVGQCMESGDESGARQLFDVIETLLILEIPVVSPHVSELVSFLIGCGGNRNYEGDLRILALNALNWTVEYKKSKIQSKGLAPQILEGLMPVATEEEPDEPEEDAPSRSALRIIDSLAKNLPPNQVFPALRQLIQQYFSSNDPSHRRGAMLALGVIVEGCSEYMTPLMSQVWPVVEAGLRDHDVTVRRASCVAVNCFCDWLEDQVTGKHDVLIPLVMTLVDDPATQKSACTALDALLEISAEVIDQYLHQLMERLTGILDTAPLGTKSVVVGAIGSAAHASKAKFLPYFPATMARVQHFLVLQNEGEEQDLRGITMDAVGTFAEAVGVQTFRPYFPDMMKQAFQGIEMGSARLRECSFLFFGVMARVFGEEFAPYLPTVVPPLLASISQQEAGEDEITLSSAELSEAFASGESASSAINITDRDGNGNPQMELEDIDVDKLLEVNSAVAVEKEIAADTVGTIFEATKNHFFPFVEQCTMELIALLPHYYEGIRKSALDSLLQIMRTFYSLSDPQEWQPGALVRVPLPQTVKELGNVILPAILEMYESEDNKGVVSTMCVGLAETICKVGPAFIEGHVETLCTLVATILEQKALCQQDPDQDEDEEAPEDSAEYDTVLISSAGDVVAALAEVLGADFAPAFTTFFPLIAKFYKKNKSLSERSSAIGCLAEIVAGLKNHVTPMTEPLLALFFEALSDDEAEVRSNAAFATGLLVEHSDADLSGRYLQILGALRPLFQTSEQATPQQLNARDNACGAVSRLIVKNTAAVPLDSVLPVVMDVLPLRNDYLENRPVFRAIFHLYRSNPQALSPYTDRLLMVFAHVLDPGVSEEQIGQEIRSELIQLVVALNAQDPGKIQQAGLAVYL